MTYEEVEAQIKRVVPGEVTYRDLAVFSVGRNFPFAAGEKPFAVAVEAATVIGKQDIVGDGNA